MSLLGLLVLIIGGKILEANPDAFNGAGTVGAWMFGIGIVLVILNLLILAVVAALTFVGGKRY